VWQPIAYAGSYGTNGFHLPFSDNSTAAALGTDTSGNGNTWTVNNISVTAGAGNDSLVDSPTNYGTDTGAGGEVRGNYATWNPLDKSSQTNIDLSNGNLQAANSSSSGQGRVDATIAVSSGKWYWETTVNGTSSFHETGIIKSDTPLAYGIGFYSSGYSYTQGGDKANSNNFSSYGSTYTNGDVIGVALDLDAGTLVFYKNGISQGTAFSSLSGTFQPTTGTYSSAANMGWIVNFGQRPFAYTAPSGFKALCTTNLPEPTIADGSTAMDVALYTGNGSTQTISGLNFSPDFVWIKERGGTNFHMLFDTIRGANVRLNSNSTNPDYTETTALTSFNSTGFSMGGNIQTNGSSQTYVAWTWDAGSSTVTNTEGSITSQVRANASAGFSVGTWTGTASAGTIGHGLGVAPEFIIVKNRSVSDSWYCYHKSLGNAARIQLNETSAQTTGSSQWNSTSPTSTVYSVGAGSWQASGNLIVSYCFAPVAGYSSFGSYTGNGSADGPFVYTGFRPRWVMVKDATQADNWIIVDAARNTYNSAGLRLFPNLSNAESSFYSAQFDFLSNGLKVRNNNGDINASGDTYVYAAFAEHPFATSRAR
jgi:hypothetical protein